MKKKKHIHLKFTAFDSEQFIVELDEKSDKSLLINILELPKKIALCRISDIAAAITENISETTGLEYSSDIPPDGRVCFAESSELRDEFKTYYTFTDLMSYITASLHLTGVKSNKTESTDSQKIDYPENVDLFWEYVNIGKEIIEKNI